jgi:mono/diheme cytochrome c family protein
MAFRTILTSTLLVPTLLALALPGRPRAADSEASNAAVRPAATAGDAASGKALYLRYCAGCHGEDGRGEAKTFRPSVGNLAVKDLMDQVPDEYLFTVIKKGGAAVGKNAAMPAWEKQLDDPAIWDIVTFVRTLARY